MKRRSSYDDLGWEFEQLFCLVVVLAFFIGVPAMAVCQLLSAWGF